MRESILTKRGPIYSQELPEVCAATGVRNHHETALGEHRRAYTERAVRRALFALEPGGSAD